MVLRDHVTRYSQVVANSCLSLPTYHITSFSSESFSFNCLVRILVIQILIYTDFVFLVGTCTSSHDQLLPLCLHKLLQ